jgi:hypothetical protein
MKTLIVLKNKEDGSLWNIISGFILPEGKYDRATNGSFLTLRSQDTGNEQLYIWKYWAENSFDIEGTVEVPKTRQEIEREEKLARDEDALLAAKADRAKERQRELEAYAKLEKEFLAACEADSDLNAYYEKVKGVLNNDAPGFFLGVREGESLSLFDKYNALGVEGIKDLLK